MKILILSFYYSPDLCAGSFRAAALVEALLTKLPQKSYIDVVTTLPNRYSSFSVDAPQMESAPGLSVRRIALPAHQSGMLDQSRAFLTYCRQVMKHVERQHYDLVLGTSSRLMTAVLAARVARKMDAPLYLDIRDIFVDTIKDVLPKWVALVVKPIFSRLERWSVQRAKKVNLVSEGFLGYFKDRYPCQKYSFFTNGIDRDFLINTDAASTEARKSNGLRTVLYAGNLGEGQGLHVILPDLALRMRGRAVFRVIGDGGRKDVLRKALAAAGADNVVLLSPVKRDVLIKEYAGADVLFLHLNDYDAFKKVLPSKIFEYAAMGKPIWAGVSGYAAEFIRAEIGNAGVFRPCDVAGAVAAFEQLDFHDSRRPDFVRKFSRTNIMEAMAEDICAVARQGH